MTVATVTNIVSRITTSKPKSAIAVFITKDGLFDALISNTITTNKLKKILSDQYLGEFFGPEGAEDFLKTVKQGG